LTKAAQVYQPIGNQLTWRNCGHPGYRQENSSSSRDFNYETDCPRGKSLSVGHENVDYLAYAVSERVKDPAANQSGHEYPGCAHRDNLIRKHLMNETMPA
jgi:hypothetical protein